MGHFCAMWIPFASGPIFYVFVELGGLSTLRARAVLEQHGPFQCYVDSIRSGDRLSMFFDLGELSTLRACARYLSNMGHFCAMWIPLVLEIDFLYFFQLGGLSTLRARGT